MVQLTFFKFFLGLVSCGVELIHQVSVTNVFSHNCSSTNEIGHQSFLWQPGS
jgi:hypothetical protein